jgi:hypothetical protein
MTKEQRCLSDDSLRWYSSDQCRSRHKSIRGSRSEISRPCIAGSIRVKGGLADGLAPAAHQRLRPSTCSSWREGQHDLPRIGAPAALRCVAPASRCDEHPCRRNHPSSLRRIALPRGWDRECSSARSANRLSRRTHSASNLGAFQFPRECSPQSASLVSSGRGNLLDRPAAPKRKRFV